MERSGLIADRGILFGGRDMIRVNLAMEMRIRGKEELYTAGKCRDQLVRGTPYL